VQVVSKNGTNELYGSAAFKYDDPNFNAYNKFGAINSPPQRVENSFRQYAASIGGPVLKNRLFYFFSYEGLRNSSNNPSTGYVETQQYRQAVLSLRPGSTTATVLNSAGIAPRVLSVIPIACASTFAPGACRQTSDGLDLGSVTGSRDTYTTGTGGGPDGIADVEYALFSNPATQNGSQYNGRVDFTRGNDTIAASSYVTLFNGLTADPSTGSRPLAELRNKPVTLALTATWNHVISATLINEAKANFTRFASDQITASSATNWGIPRIEVESYPFGRLELGAPRSESSPAVFAQNTIEGRDALNWVRGSHATNLVSKSVANRTTIISRAARVPIVPSPDCSTLPTILPSSKRLTPTPAPAPPQSRSGTFATLSTPASFRTTGKLLPRSRSISA
jgi:hypothetical protein